MRLWDEESFGPVTAFATFESLDEGIELVNASDYSLVASVWTSDVYIAQEATSRFRAGSHLSLRYVGSCELNVCLGTIDINGTTIHFEHPTGIVGLGGSSGYGRFDVENFTIKHCVILHQLGRTYPLTS
ncbi:Aldehyde/histidinol dehydrogenase [Infundibulicybe gibba]|nr:Aldehyde/histidinol dehydrogenase [Infundibulicybe gibba]